MAKKPSDEQPLPLPDQADVYTFTDLEQVKVIADPLRVRILEVLCDGGRTTKQVAELLGEKPTRLYHHVEALERVGLIRLVETRQNRGTVEKYFGAVARVFRSDPALFRTRVEPGDEAPVADIVTTIMENTTAELRRLIEAGHDVSSTDECVLSYVELHGSKEKIDTVRAKLLEIVTELAESCCEKPPDDGGRRYRLSLAYFPLDKTES